MLEDNVTTKLVKYFSELKYEDIPEDAINIAKRVFLDAMGCALASHDLDKGSLAVKTARNIGGNPQASIIGSGDQTSMCEAAFANGELIHTMDNNALTPPLYVAPFVIPAVLAAAENRKATGKEFLAAMVAAFEISSRVGLGMGNFRSRAVKLNAYGTTWDTLGAALGAGRIFGLDLEQMADAVGLAGYLSPVPSLMKYMHTANNGLMKFGPAGWTNEAGVKAAMMAEAGARGDRSLLDGEYGYWAMNGAPSCNYDIMTEDLGTKWTIRDSNKFKSLPCDGSFHSPMTPLIELIEEEDLKPEEIESITVFCEENMQFPQYGSRIVENNVDASMSFHYCMALAAHRIPVGPIWQRRETYTNPSIQEFMKTKTHIVSYDVANESRTQELEVEGRMFIVRRPSKVEVKARGTVYTRTAEYAKWLSSEIPEFRATNEDLVNKFFLNTADVMDREKAQKAADMMLNLENVDDMSKVVDALKW